jgi:hypothetical protein
MSDVRGPRRGSVHSRVYIYLLHGSVQGCAWTKHPTAGQAVSQRSADFGAAHGDSSPLHHGLLTVTEQRLVVQEASACTTIDVRGPRRGSVHSRVYIYLLHGSVQGWCVDQAPDCGARPSVNDPRTSGKRVGTVSPAPWPVDGDPPEFDGPGGVCLHNKRCAWSTQRVCTLPCIYIFITRECTRLVRGPSTRPRGTTVSQRSADVGAAHGDSSPLHHGMLTLTEQRLAVQEASACTTIDVRGPRRGSVHSRVYIYLLHGSVQGWCVDQAPGREARPSVNDPRTSGQARDRTAGLVPWRLTRSVFRATEWDARPDIARVRTEGASCRMYWRSPTPTSARCCC